MTLVLPLEQYYVGRVLCAPHTYVPVCNHPFLVGVDQGSVADWVLPLSLVYDTSIATSTGLSSTVPVLVCAGARAVWYFAPPHLITESICPTEGAAFYHQA